MHEPYLKQLEEIADPARAEGMRGYHKIERPYLGLANPQVDALTKEWRKELDVPGRVSVAKGLWGTNIYEARLAAAKLLTQARIRPDDTVWALIQSWVPDFDSWALADHACMAGQKRMSADPARLEDVEPWTQSDHMWTRRAALVITLPWCKNRNAKAEELAQRERILGWAAGYVPDRDWFIQKAIAWWLRDLSKRDPERVQAFLDTHGDAMKPFARKEAGKYL
ncbi:MAG: DNA alkylation repair protein [Paracoccaceae bacterium]